jgi:hypothetical protein
MKQRRRMIASYLIEHFGSNTTSVIKPPRHASRPSHAFPSARVSNAATALPTSQADGNGGAGSRTRFHTPSGCLFNVRQITPTLRTGTAIIPHHERYSTRTWGDAGGVRVRYHEEDEWNEKEKREGFPFFRLNRDVAGIRQPAVPTDD